MRRSRVALVVAAIAVCVASARAYGVSAPARHGFDFAAARSATIHPGIMVYAGNEQCTANFVFTNGFDVFLGQSAHCISTGANTATNGCTTDSLPLGTEIADVDGNRLGTIAYSSWLSMKAVGEQDPDACNYNDISLIKLDSSLISSTNPSVPVFGGPTGVRRSVFPTGAQSFFYGNSSLRQGLTTLSPHRGYVISNPGHGWAHTAYNIPPGIPGDSGSAMVDTSGRAAGVQSTLVVQPYALANNFADLGKMMDYAAAHGFPFTLVNGDQSFDHGLLRTLVG